MHIDGAGNLVTFIDRENAERYARQNGFYIEEGNEICVVVLSLDKMSLWERIDRERQDGAIRSVKVYGKRPFYVLCPVELFEVKMKPAAKQEDKVPEQPIKEQIKQPTTGETKKPYVLVDDIKKFLDTAEVAMRRAVNPGLSYENVHDVIENLIAKNRLEKEDIEKELDLPAGWLTSFCKDKTSAKTSKETLKKLLQYFGLGEYIYQYKNYCEELLRELKDDKAIDNYEILESTVATNKEYKIMSIRRGKIKKDDAFAYRLLLKCGDEELEVCVSSPRGFVVGREYEIVELDGKKQKPAPVSKSNSPNDKKENSIPINNPASQRYISRAEEKAKYGRRNDANPISKDTDEIIRYLKEEYGDTAQAANQKLLKFLKHEDIIRSFALYIRKKNPGKARSLDYTAGRLMSELHYEPYEAYCILADLREKPKETKQMLIYRERDPQYQS